jgi:hypothetical protein
MPSSPPSPMNIHAAIPPSGDDVAPIDTNARACVGGRVVAHDLLQGHEILGLSGPTNLSVKPSAGEINV